MAKAKSIVPDLPSIITVEVVGYETPQEPGTPAPAESKKEGKKKKVNP
jgi:hypothetical protein